MATVEIQFRHLIPPIERDCRFEEPLDEFLRSSELGYVSGGGTDLGLWRSDISLEVSDPEIAVPLIRAELRRLKAPWLTRVRVIIDPVHSGPTSVGQVVLVPIGPGKFAIAKILVISESLKEYGYILLGVYCAYSPEVGLEQVPPFPARVMCTFSFSIQNNEWQTIGQSDLSNEEREAFPDPDFELEGTSIFPPKLVEREAAKMFEQ